MPLKAPFMLATNKTAANKSKQKNWRILYRVTLFRADFRGVNFTLDEKTMRPSAYIPVYFYAAKSHE